MVNFCAVFGCGNRADREKDLSYFRLPTVRQKHGEQTLQLSEERQRMWLSNIGRSDIKISNFPYKRVCSNHFVSGKPADLYDKTNVDWVPTLKLGHVRVLPSPSAATDRYNRVLGRIKKRKRIDAAETLVSLQDILVDDQTCETEESVDHNTREIQTDIMGHNLEAIQQGMRRLTVENSELKSEIASRKMAPESLEGNDDKVIYLTGLPTHHILMQVFSLISSYLTETHLSPLTKFQQLMLTLMKLRLNVHNEFLGIIFQCAQPTVSRTFLNTLHVLTRLQPLIRWPERERRSRRLCPWSSGIT